MSAEIARLGKQKAAEYIRAARAAAARQDRTAAGAALLEASKWAQLTEANGAPRPSVPWSLLDGLPTPWPSERGGVTVPMFANPAPAGAPPKPSILRGKAREVLARAGTSATLAELAAIACVDEAAARRIARTLERAGAALETKPGRWKLDPSALEQCPPPQVATVRAVAPCAGECGKWRLPAKHAPGWIGALGPSAPLFDSEGRPYRVTYALARASELGRSFHASHLDGKADPLYLPELQARARSSAVSDAQIAAIADELSVPRWIAPSSTPTDGTPIVWHVADDGTAQALSGNGRLAAWKLAAPTRARVAAAVSERWNIPTRVRALLEAEDLIPVRIFDGPKVDAVRLAAASQTAAAGALTASERATTAVRALGLTLEGMPPIVWMLPVNATTIAGFARANARWIEWALAPLDRARRMTIQGDAASLAEHVLGVLVGLLPDAARVPPIGGTPLDRALLGALPGIWTTRDTVRQLEAGAAWDLVSAVAGAREWARKLKPERLAALGSELAQAERQGALFEDQITAEADPRAAALGAVLARAAGRTSPEDAAAEYIARFVEAIPDPRQMGLLIPDASAPDAATVLATIARVRLKRANPRDRVLASWAAAWHWGRYDSAKIAKLERRPSDPAEGFALGELAALTIGKVRYLAPPGHLLCADRPGKAARLFVVAPLVLAAEGELTWIEYLADKGTDGPSHYVHRFRGPFPHVSGPTVTILRAQSRFSVDLDRGITG